MAEAMVETGAKGFIIAAPHSGSGKTLITLGLCRALTQVGISVAPAKSGPDYIDPHYLARAARQACVNLDAWAMTAKRIAALAADHSQSEEMLVVEGVMGLFDGAQNGAGSTGDLASMLALPVVLVIDASHMAQSVAAIAEGFIRFRKDVLIAGVILNRVASDKHEAMLRDALRDRNIACFGAVRRDENLSVPSRHLGLVLPQDMAGVDDIIDAAAKAVADQIDIAGLTAIATPLRRVSRTSKLPPLGQHIAIARDDAFSFAYTHWLEDWREQGAGISFFSPLANEAPAVDADAVFLPGGYPELHGATLAAADDFSVGLAAARDRNALIYGECGGYMVLGSMLTDKYGATHKMTGLLPHATTIDRPRRTLGYRQLKNRGPLPFGEHLNGHEFHYSTQTEAAPAPLFEARDATGMPLAPMGSVHGKVCGSYAHIIDVAGAS